MKILPSLFLAIAGICGVVIIWQLKQPSATTAPTSTSDKFTKNGTGSPRERASARNLPSDRLVRSDEANVPPSRQSIPALTMRTNAVAANLNSRTRISNQTSENLPPVAPRTSSSVGLSTPSGISSAAPTARSSQSTSPGPGGRARYEEVTEYSQPPLAYSIPADRSKGLPPVEQSALKVAQESFDKRLSEYGPLDPSSEEYFYAYRESSQASDDFLRAYLGWDRYMSLSAEALQETTDQLAGARGSATP